MSDPTVVIVGGVAGGASAAARARRLSERAEIIVFERGPYVSFANCGLPYYVGGEIRDRSHLLLQTPEGLRARFNLDVRIETDIVAIDRDACEVVARRAGDGLEYRQRYDALVLSTGAAPLRPPIPGIDRPGHFVLRNVPDALEVDAFLARHPGCRAVVIGGGYIGLEMAEQLARRRLTVTVVEALPQVAGFLDPEMAALVHAEIRRNHVTLHLGNGVSAFEAPAAPGEALTSVVVLSDGTRIPADLVLLGMGVKPETTLAQRAGLEIGVTGGIRVDERLRTSDPRIWAVGDAIEVRHGVTGQPMLLPLAGPANRQGRIAAENILGRQATYQATFGTGVLRVFGLTVGGTGANSRMLRQAGITFGAVHLHPLSHAGYYPGAVPLSIKLLYEPATGRVLGAQTVGKEGVDKRLDVLATAIQAGLTVSQVAQLELGYAPPFGSAKDPVNLAGMVAENVRNGDVAVAHYDEVAALDRATTVLLDVREPMELRDGVIPGSVHISLGELRARMDELPKDKEIVVYCRSGQRSYYACRTLSQNGYRTRNLSGAYLTWHAMQA